MKNSKSGVAGSPKSMKKKVILNKFFAVTLTSVYEVKSDGGDGYPIAKKIALKGESAVPIGEHLRGGTMIAICKFLVAYIPEKYGACHPMSGVERKIEMVNTFYCGGNTSSIVALFKNEKDAFACFENKNLNPCDPKWIKQTKEVIDAIGDNHPSFEVCKHKGLALDCVL